MAQAKTSTAMAGHLDSLTSHFDQMAAALRESEAGEVFSEDDLQGTVSLMFLCQVFITATNSLM